MQLRKALLGMSCWPVLDVSTAKKTIPHRRVPESTTAAISHIQGANLDLNRAAHSEVVDSFGDIEAAGSAAVQVDNSNGARRIKALVKLGMEHLEAGLTEQRRRLLQVHDELLRAQFDEAWCLDSTTGNFLKIEIVEERQHSNVMKLSVRQNCAACWLKVRNVRCGLCRSSNGGQPSSSLEAAKGNVDSDAAPTSTVVTKHCIRDIIEQNLEEVHREFKEIYEELACQTSAERGFEILVQFILDVLGRKSAAAHIYAMKMDMEYTKTEY
ncbi:hypothetical protein EON65_58080, partial [archaeon]